MIGEDDKILRSKRTGKQYTRYGEYSWMTYSKAKEEVPGTNLSELGVLLNKMLDSPNEWLVCYSGWGSKMKMILRHPRGDIGLDVTYKYCFDVEGRAVLTLEDRATLWPKARAIVEAQTKIPNLDFDNRCTEYTRKSNRRKFFKEVMASILEIEGGSQKNK